MIPIGLTLQPDEAYLGLLDPLLRTAVDYYEVAPETTWRPPESPTAPLLENGFHRAFQKLAAETGRWFVGHGVGFSVGTSSRSDAARRRQWLARLQKDQEAFRFAWYTDHLGSTSIAGHAATLPLPLLMNAYSAQVVRRRLQALQRVVPRVGVENTVCYFLLGEPLAEPLFLRRVLQRPGCHLLLDLHNVYTMAENFGFAPADYLARLDLAKVIEIHVSGGQLSDGGWLPEQRQLRLDSHDAQVPEPVWALLAQVLPRCTGLRGITLERMEGTVTAADVPLLAEELRRIRSIAAQVG